MSVFKVTLQQGAQGALDRDPSTMSAGAIAGQGLGSPFGVSKQRQVYVMGPNKINRLLKDGDTFTDCNYWKQFAYPQVSLEKAFITVVTDDGSTWVPGQVGTVPIAVSDSLTSLTALTVNFAAGTTTNHSNVTTALSATGPATFLQLENLAGAGTNPVTVLLNGVASFTLTGGATQIFNSGDLTASSVVITAASGSTASVQVIAAVESVCLS